MAQVTREIGAKATLRAMESPGGQTVESIPESGTKDIRTVWEPIITQTVAVIRVYIRKVTNMGLEHFTSLMDEVTKVNGIRV